MKLKSTPRRIIRRLPIPSPLKLASIYDHHHPSNAKKPLLVPRESSDGTQSGKVPKGFLAVYVGPHLRRFVIPVTFLAMPDFRILMESVAEEYGCDHHGAIQIPCDEDYFQHILNSCSHRPGS